mmetsp:Transcript_28950/g.56828  ORF Transcript_28950/g.56828 Transcript_28950/m.56828 type:complete len:206 (-) Transcript_28950:104-721(-)
MLEPSVVTPTAKNSRFSKWRALKLPRCFVGAFSKSMLDVLEQCTIIPFAKEVLFRFVYRIYFLPIGECSSSVFRNGRHAVVAVFGETRWKNNGLHKQERIKQFVTRQDSIFVVSQNDTCTTHRMTNTNPSSCHSFRGCAFDIFYHFIHRLRKHVPVIWSVRFQRRVTVRRKINSNDSRKSTGQDQGQLLKHRLPDFFVKPIGVNK